MPIKHSIPFSEGMGVGVSCKRAEGDYVCSSLYKLVAFRSLSAAQAKCLVG